MNQDTGSVLSSVIFDVMGFDPKATTVVLSHWHQDEVPVPGLMAGRKCVVTSETCESLRRHGVFVPRDARVLDSSTLGKPGDMRDFGDIVVIKNDHSTPGTPFKPTAAFSFLLKERHALLVAECTGTFLSSILPKLVDEYHPEEVVLPAPSMAHGLDASQLQSAYAFLTARGIRVTVASNAMRPDFAAKIQRTIGNVECAGQVVESLLSASRRRPS